MLPRPVETRVLLAWLIGGVGGGMLGQAVGGGAGAVFGALAGGVGCHWAINWRPWQGEGAVKVGFVKAGALRRTKRLVCPGTALPLQRDLERGTEFCGTCGLICDVDVDEGLRVAARHEWRRQVYVGCLAIQPEPTEVRMIPGSIEVGDVPKPDPFPTGLSNFPFPPPSARVRRVLISAEFEPPAGEHGSVRAAA